MRVLIIEDEQRVAANIAAALREGPGYAVDIASDGETGASLACEGSYDLVVLDLMLPRMHGLRVLETIRQARQAVPVLVLTARSEKESVISLLNAGADDYLSKPFDLGELLARAKSLVRRGKGVAHPLIEIGNLRVDTLEKVVDLDGVRIELSPTEYRILEYMVHHRRSIISKQALLEHLYDFNWERHSNVVEAHISNLRRKLTVPSDEDGSAANTWIETLRGRGYRLVVPKAIEA